MNKIIWKKCWIIQSIIFLMLTISAMMIAGCESEEATSNNSEIAYSILGNHIDEYGSVHEVSTTDWRNGSVYGNSEYRVLQIDTGSNFLVARNDDGNGFNPGKYSRFDWTTHAGNLYYCQSAFAEETALAALNATPPDTSDPGAGGCGGFPWTQMPQGSIEVMGVYQDAFGSSHAITQTLWDQSSAAFTFLFHIIEADNSPGYLLAENDAANSFNPGLFSRFYWTPYLDNLYYCQDVFDAASPDDARAATPPDATDPTTGGCGGFAWTNLTP